MKRKIKWLITLLGLGLTDKWSSFTFLIKLLGRYRSGWRNWQGKWNLTYCFLECRGF
ncbi:Uncharacterized protein TCM_037309 [Theobroma cacao]|uniref:Uncharacterized protein n=1 Tax=Theobroma cacao TaxID=3641 RepID=A0A061GS14_THECC|nr:Uncharacterized protein TCM_037309 [Theobroma cacao]